MARKKSYKTIAQKGGQTLPPIYTSDPNSKELRAFRDSTDLGNLSKYQQTLKGNSGKRLSPLVFDNDLSDEARAFYNAKKQGELDKLFKGEKTYSASDYERATGKSAYKKSDSLSESDFKMLNKVKNTGNNNIYAVQRGSPEFYHKNIMPISYYGEASKGPINQIYKEPVQPVIYKKSQQKEPIPLDDFDKRELKKLGITNVIGKNPAKITRYNSPNDYDRQYDYVYQKPQQTPNIKELKRFLNNPEFIKSVMSNPDITAQEFSLPKYDSRPSAYSDTWRNEQGQQETQYFENYDKWKAYQDMNRGFLHRDEAGDKSRAQSTSAYRSNLQNGGIPVAQKGLYMQDEEFNDSLRKYNSSKIQYDGEVKEDYNYKVKVYNELMNSSYFTKEDKAKFIKPSMSDYPLYGKGNRMISGKELSKILNSKLININGYAQAQDNPYGTGIYDKTLIRNWNSKIKPIGAYIGEGGIHNAIYKKPVGKPKIQLKRQLTTNSHLNTQFSIPDITAQEFKLPEGNNYGTPSEFSHTWRDDKGQQQSRYFPDADSWEEFQKNIPSRNFMNRNINNNRTQASSLADGYSGFQNGGNVNDDNGYLTSNLHNFTPRKRISSGHITTQGMAFPIYANGQYLEPNTGDYYFDGPVDEVPAHMVAQKGGQTLPPIYTSDPNSKELKAFRDSTDLEALSRNIPRYFPHLPEISKDKFNEIKEKDHNLTWFELDKVQYLKDKKQGKIKNLENYVYSRKSGDYDHPLYQKNNKSEWDKYDHDVERFAITLPDGKLKIPGTVYDNKPDWDSYTIVDLGTGSDRFYQKDLSGKHRLTGIYNEHIKPEKISYYGSDKPVKIGELTNSSTGWYSGKQPSMQEKQKWINYYMQHEDKKVYKKPVQPVIYKKSQQTPKINKLNKEEIRNNLGIGRIINPLQINSEFSIPNITAQEFKLPEGNNYGIPSEFSHTWRDEKGQQQSRYFPTKEEWDKFIKNAPSGSIPNSSSNGAGTQASSLSHYYSGFQKGGIPVAQAALQVTPNNVYNPGNIASHNFMKIIDKYGADPSKVQTEGSFWDENKGKITAGLSAAAVTALAVALKKNPAVIKKLIGIGTEGKQLGNIQKELKTVTNNSKSEINWSKWNKEIPENKALMQNTNELAPPPHEIILDEHRFNLERLVPKNKRKMRSFDDSDISGGLTLRNNPSRVENIESILGKRRSLKSVMDKKTGESIDLKTWADDDGQLYYYMSANMPSSKIKAGKAYLEIEKYIPKEASLLENSSLSYDSFLNILKQTKNPKFETFVKGKIPMNNNAKTNILKIQGDSNLGSNYYNSESLAKDATNELNKLLNKYNLPEATVNSVKTSSGRVQMYEIQLPNIGLKKLYSIIGIGGTGAYMQNNKYRNGGTIGNNGMFDMTNPNIYKALVPAGIVRNEFINSTENMKQNFQKGGQGGIRNPLDPLNLNLPQRQATSEPSFWDNHAGKVTAGLTGAAALAAMIATKGKSKNIVNGISKAIPKVTSRITRGPINYWEEPGFAARNPNYNHEASMNSVNKFGETHTKITDTYLNPYLKRNNHVDNMNIPAELKKIDNSDFNYVNMGEAEIKGQGHGVDFRDYEKGINEPAWRTDAGRKVFNWFDENRMKKGDGIIDNLLRPSNQKGGTPVAQGGNQTDEQALAGHRYGTISEFRNYNDPRRNTNSTRGKMSTEQLRNQVHSEYALPGVPINVEMDDMSRLALEMADLSRVSSWHHIPESIENLKNSESILGAAGNAALVGLNTMGAIPLIGGIPGTVGRVAKAAPAAYRTLTGLQKAKRVAAYLPKKGLQALDKVDKVVSAPVKALDKINPLVPNIGANFGPRAQSFFNSTNRMNQGIRGFDAAFGVTVPPVAEAYSQIKNWNKKLGGGIPAFQDGAEFPRIQFPQFDPNTPFNPMDAPVERLDLKLPSSIYGQLDQGKGVIDIKNKDFYNNIPAAGFNKSKTTKERGFGQPEVSGLLMGMSMLTDSLHNKNAQKGVDKINAFNQFNNPVQFTRQETFGNPMAQLGLEFDDRMMRDSQMAAYTSPQNLPMESQMLANNNYDIPATEGSENYGGNDINPFGLSSSFAEYANKANIYLKNTAPSTDITGEMLATAAETAYRKYNKIVPLELALAQLTQEGYFAKSKSPNKPQRTRNPFNVGNTDDGSIVSHDNLQSGINSYYELISKYYLNKNEPEQLLEKFTNSAGNRYAKDPGYEQKLRNIISTKVKPAISRLNVAAPKRTGGQLSQDELFKYIADGGNLDLIR